MKRYTRAVSRKRVLQVFPSAALNLVPLRRGNDLFMDFVLHHYRDSIRGFI